jgi:hypothetical protein
VENNQNEMSELDELNQLVKEQNEENEGSGGKSYLTKEEKKAKEFKLTKGEEVIRFLYFDKTKDKTDSKFYASAQFHNVKIGDYMQKVYCNKNDGKECPLCIKSKKIMDTQTKGGKNLDEATKEKNKGIYKNAKAMEAKDYKIFKIVDVGSRKDGIKFWRTTQPYEGQSVFEKFATAVKSFHNSNRTSTYEPKHGSLSEGGNFSINSIQKTLNTNKKIKYWEVSSIMPYDNKTTAIGDDKCITTLEEEKVEWRDIFNKFEIKDVMDFDLFLTLCADGNAPYWDKDNKTFVFPNNPELARKYSNVLIERNSGSSSSDEDEDDQDDQDDTSAKVNAVLNTGVVTSMDDIDENEDVDADFNDDDELPF